MKIFHLIFLTAALSLPMVSCDGGIHLISDARERAQVFEDFGQRRGSLPEGDLFGIFDESGSGTKLNGPETEAMRFLYAYMPLSDIADHDGSFFLDNIRASLRARDEMPWGHDIPEREFRHFVLPVRVNNENLDRSRMVFYEELKDRVAGLTLREAILEINHWCHEKVTYTPSDARTSSPLASVMSAYGRCGEESTFTVAALRAMCIPARQVYTPRWAHTDDNHAWVEAWVDGEWHFLGACEPEPVLDLGWFNEPVSRGMLMHTKVFGRYEGPEEKMRRTDRFTEINVTGNYADTASVAVKVVDTAGEPVAGCCVEFKIYNYAEFYTVSRKATDTDGKVSLSAGKGDMLVWASDNGRFGFGKISFGKDKERTIVLDKTAGDAFSEEFDIIPPDGKCVMPEVTAMEREANNRRLAEEDAIRNAYTATFPTEAEITDFAIANGLDTESAISLVKGARGNYAEIMKFMESLQTPARKRDGIGLLQHISAKDLRDTGAGVLTDHLQDTECSSDIERKYLRNPRISTELLTPYKSCLLQAMETDDEFATESLRMRFKDEPERLIEWVKENIRTDGECNLGGAPISPAGVWKCRTADIRSRDIFFVAMARTLGIPARINEVDGKVQIFTDTGSGWTVSDVDFDESSQEYVPSGRLLLTPSATNTVGDPEYYSHFTIAKILGDGSTRLMSYEEGGELTWSAAFSGGVVLDEGNYVLVTGNRLAKGGVLVRVSSFGIGKGRTTETGLDIRTSESEVQVIGHFNSESAFTLPEGDGAVRTVLSMCGRGYFALGIVASGHEPSNHALKDISAMKEDFEQWGRRIVILFEDMRQYREYMDSGFPAAMPATTVYGIDSDGSIRKQMAEGLGWKDGASLPAFIIGDTFNRVVFSSRGYTIGLGQQMMKVISRL